MYRVQCLQYFPTASLFGSSGSAKRRLVIAIKSALPSRSICSPRSGSSLPTVMTGRETTFLHSRGHVRVCACAVMAHIEFFRERSKRDRRFRVEEVIRKKGGIMSSDPLRTYLNSIGPCLFDNAGNFQASSDVRHSVAFNTDERPGFHTIDNC